MKARSLVVASLLLCSACASPGIDVAAERAASAERFFRGVYGGDPSVVDDLAHDDVFLSYEVFERIFGAPTIRGREAVKRFAAGFAERWTDARIVVHETVSEGNNVVLLWSFRARMVDAQSGGVPATDQERSWGGITLFRFDEAGKILAEIGEESEPGPAQRSANDGGAGASDRGTGGT